MEKEERKREKSASFLTTGELAELMGETTGQINRVFSKNDLIRMAGNRREVPPKLVREYLGKSGVDYSFRVIAHVNLRGGIGKTISTVSLAVRAAQYGFNTCVLDLDPQGSSSLAFDLIPDDEDPIFYDIWQNASKMIKGSLKRVQEGLYLLPSSLDNSLLDSVLINPASQKNAVRSVCRELENMGFDLVVVDCPPSLGSAVVSTVCAANTLVIPVSSDAFSFKGLELTLNEIISICQSFGLKRPDVKVLYTKYDRRELISKEALTTLSKAYEKYLIPVVIRTSTDYSKALERRESIFAVSQKTRAKEDYEQYARHILGLRSFTSS